MRSGAWATTRAATFDSGQTRIVMSRRTVLFALTGRGRKSAGLAHNAQARHSCKGKAGLTGTIAGRYDWFCVGNGGPGRMTIASSETTS